jgi:hypothetical protein
MKVNAPYNIYIDKKCVKRESSPIEITGIKISPRVWNCPTWMKVVPE